MPSVTGVPDKCSQRDAPQDCQVPAELAGVDGLPGRQATATQGGELRAARCAPAFPAVMPARQRCDAEPDGPAPSPHLRPGRTRSAFAHCLQSCPRAGAAAGRRRAAVVGQQQSRHRQAEVRRLGDGGHGLDQDVVAGTQLIAQCSEGAEGVEGVEQHRVAPQSEASAFAGAVVTAERHAAGQRHAVQFHGVGVGVAVQQDVDAALDFAGDGAHDGRTIGDGADVAAHVDVDAAGDAGQAGAYG